MSFARNLVGIHVGKSMGVHSVVSSRIVQTSIRQWGDCHDRPGRLDRVTQACARRFDLDEAQPTAQLFYGLPVGPAGSHLLELGHEGVTLLFSVYSREAFCDDRPMSNSSNSVSCTRRSGKPQSLNPVREWGTLSFFVALTSIESLFY